MVIEKLIKDFDKLSPSEKVRKFEEMKKQMEEEGRELRKEQFQIDSEIEEKKVEEEMSEKHETQLSVEEEKPLERIIDKAPKIEASGEYIVKVSDDSYEKVTQFSEGLYLSKNEEEELKSAYSQLNKINDSYLSEGQKRLKDELRSMGTVKKWWEETNYR
jgi:hypothetical protein